MSFSVLHISSALHLLLKSSSALERFQCFGTWTLSQSPAEQSRLMFRSHTNDPIIGLKNFFLRVDFVTMLRKHHPPAFFREMVAALELCTVWKFSMHFHRYPSLVFDNKYEVCPFMIALILDCGGKTLQPPTLSLGLLPSLQTDSDRRHRDRDCNFVRD
ncbi:MAG: hypothetical protein IPK68_22125 [Bdellovibrionales bacterium]|nr:hypothetical protein [Bdellovibrionales bacterium]